MTQLMQLDVTRFWPSGHVEEGLVSVMSRCTYVMLENPTNCKVRSTREHIAHLIGTLVHRYDHVLGATTAMVHLLPHFEHLPSPLVAILATIAHDYHCPRIVMDIVREIGRMEAESLARDTSGTRIITAFLVELSETLPAIVLPCVAVLVPHLDGESYTMRNAVISMLGQLLCSGLDRGEGPMSRATRDGFLDILYDRLRDVNAFVRARALQTWLQLVQAKCIPLTGFSRGMDGAIGRLADKSSAARRQAVILLTAMLRENPFGAELRVDQLRSRLETEHQKLASMCGTDGETVPTAATAAMAPPMPTAAEADGAGGSGSWTRAIGDAGATDDDAGTKPPAGGESSEDAQRQAVVVQYLADAVRFAVQLDAAVPKICDFLDSKTASDVTEAVAFIVAAAEFGIARAHVGVRRMLALAWSKDANIKQAGIDAYHRLHLQADSPVVKTLGGCGGAAGMARALVASVHGSSAGELASLEEVLRQLMGAGRVPAAVIKRLVDMCLSHGTPAPGGNAGLCTPADACAALVLLGMLARAEPGIIRANLAALLDIALPRTAVHSLSFARAACVALQSLGVAAGQEPARFPGDSDMFARIERLLVTAAVEHGNGDAWMGTCEQGINAIYALAEAPDIIAERLIRQLHGLVFGSRAPAPEDGADAGVPTERLAKLIFLVGHVALRQLIHLDAIMCEMKRRNALLEKAADTRKCDTAAGRAASAKSQSAPKPDQAGRAVTGKPAGRVRSLGDDSSNSSVSAAADGAEPPAPDEADAMETELGVVAAAEDAEQEFLTTVCEREIVLGDHHLLAIYGPVIARACMKNASCASPLLMRAATLALCKFMCVSSIFCESHLRLVFTLLETVRVGGPGGGAQRVVRVVCRTHRLRVRCTVAGPDDPVESGHCHGRPDLPLSQRPDAVDGAHVRPPQRHRCGCAQERTPGTGAFDPERHGQGEGSDQQHGAVSGGSRRKHCQAGACLLSRALTEEQRRLQHPA